MKQARSSAIGYPRIGEKREWKKALERYWKKDTTEQELVEELTALRHKDWKKQKEAGLDLIPVGDFSYYDHVLDTSIMFGIIPKRFQDTEPTSLETYFNIARGTESAVASSMTKWFNTNYHYIVPEIEKDTKPVLLENRPLRYYKEAKEQLGIDGKPVLLGPVTYLKLAKGFDKQPFEQVLQTLVPLYIQVLQELAAEGAAWVQIDEPILVTDLSEKDLRFVQSVYDTISKEVSGIKLLLQTYFEAVEAYDSVIQLPVDGIGLDFVDNNGQTLSQLAEHGFPNDKVLAAGVINGRNIWRNDWKHTWQITDAVRKIVPEDRLILQPSTSLLHVPVTTESETKLASDLKQVLAFADQKLEETVLLTKGVNQGKAIILPEVEKHSRNWRSFADSEGRSNENVQQEVKRWKDKHPSRASEFSNRKKVQEEKFALPLLPTTTIGSLPQTTEIRKARANFRKGAWSEETYDAFVKERTAEWIANQEEVGLDVLVHGEFERNDMVEYFGEKLNGFAFTEYAWVQSYGSRCVKPPIIFGDVSLPAPMTVKESAYAQSLTNKPVKGMLTGPITILNWSFVREDIPFAEVTEQIALALQKEIRALEDAGIGMIQVDEPALREGLPLKSNKQATYLDQSVRAFLLATAAAADETQIHTHMCYSEFGRIIATIDKLDADVISIETARSHGELIEAFETFAYDKGIGLGVYDIHSPRIPSVEEMEQSIRRALKVLDPRQFWINPDCGLKTRGIKETLASLHHMQQAAQNIREQQKTTILQ
ncbi:5-methyltetrahydropteroyltriglutamate--homocysteine S-methyltransferase [Halobacillus sp. KGW1]|uniref:5-methyltetrahydropteroyltriglutamate-- homocysteine S-methyltransferase n=1 Tax=Halobacillus sp. KGW1 TaxID=1793726 RepID=UPI0007835096|nr:5-methyltetrahydropteroyltriglutamate--homocysteine S-methyltransferase [Halobacillus sp. KGW1]